MFFSMPESLKIVLPSRRELDFHKIALFEFNGKSFQKINEKPMDFEVENRGNSMKKRLKKRSIFSHRFFIDFSLILASFWWVLARFWPPFCRPKGPRKRHK